MTTASELKLHTVKDLAAMAKSRGIPGWHAMRKQELVEALVKADSRSKSRSGGKKGAAAASATSNGKPRSRKRNRSERSGNNGRQTTKVHGKSQSKPKAHGQNGAGRKESYQSGKTTSPQRSSPGSSTTPSQSRSAGARLRELWSKLGESKNLATTPHENASEDDRLILMVRDSYWLHAYWELTKQSVARARAALGQHWHVARPILRLWQVTHDAAASSERRLLQDIEIHGRVCNWYINVNNPPQSFQVDIGYLVPDARFFSLARSNTVTTPQTGSCETVDLNWESIAQDYERIYALSRSESPHDEKRLREVFEERLGRPMTGPVVAPRGFSSDEEMENVDFPFEVDTELVVTGQVRSDARVAIKGEPIDLESDGTFSVRFHLGDRRQVLPIVARSGNGLLQRTIVLAVERNTKVMEPIVRDPDD